MLILALDTTTTEGSLALARDGRLIEARSGLGERTHGERLPSEITTLLGLHDAALRDIDRFVVAAGPGSFTGLRVGIATVQGLALALGRKAIAISVLDALLEIGIAPDSRRPSPPEAILAWMDGKRGEVFAALYLNSTEPEAWRLHLGPVAERPDTLLERWAGDLNRPRLSVVGDAVTACRNLLETRLPSATHLVGDLPPIAGALAVMATRPPWSENAHAPHAIQPVYVRRPDAERARDRRRQIK
ncbi:MAG: tRNA (adenosine(37)-N6)-threonylcarbamoyltransferase complex dimerization subunit type 1 TsaB [Acidobacteria bacterium]|nr:tRNA (adenosine(37)-N6)-threonylcarbamoyltransferase complex dimerization subunit type 1 TsaB [Acidobacteriota bacterium]